MHIIPVALIILLAGPLPSLAQESCQSECQSQLITDYYIGIDKISMTGSTLEDIDSFLNSLHADVRYIHVEYGADFDQQTWRRAFVRQWEAGNYNGTPEAVTTVNHIIHGYNYAAVEFVSRYNDEETNELIVSPPRLAVFSFTDGKISSIRDHWHHLAEY